MWVDDGMFSVWQLMLASWAFFICCYRTAFRKTDFSIIFFFFDKKWNTQWMFRTAWHNGYHHIFFRLWIIKCNELIAISFSPRDHLNIFGILLFHFKLNWFLISNFQRTCLKLCRPMLLFSNKMFHWTNFSTHQLSESHPNQIGHILLTERKNRTVNSNYIYICPFSTTVTRSFKICMYRWLNSFINNDVFETWNWYTICIGHNQIYTLNSKQWKQNSI